MSNTNHTNDTVATCSICTPAKKPLYNATDLINDFPRTERFFSQSHEGAWRAGCKQCGSQGIYYWVEVYDDIWMHWGAATEQEVNALLEEVKNDPAPFASEERFRAFFKGRMHAEQSPSGIRCWTDDEILEGAPF